VESLGFSTYKIVSSTKRDNFASFSPIWIASVSFFGLIALAIPSSTMFNKSDERGHPCPVPDPRGKAFCSSP